MRIATRLAIGFTALTGLMLVSIVITSINLRSIDLTTDELVERDLASIALAADVLEEANSIRAGIRNVLLFEAAERQDELADIRQAEQKLLSVLDQLNALPQSDTGRAMLTDIREADRLFMAALGTQVQRLEQGGLPGAMPFFQSQIRPLGLAVVDSVQKYLDHLEGVISQTNEDLTAQIASLSRLLMILMGLALVSGVTAGWLITRAVTRPLGAEPDQTNAVLKEVAEGNLAAPVEVRAGDHASVMAQIQRMQQQLSQTLHRIRGSAGSLDGSSAELSSSAEQLAQASRGQTDSATAMASAIEQLSVSISQVADSATEAAEVSALQRQQAQAGASVIRKVQGSIQNIAVSVDETAADIDALKRQSDQIGVVIQVINDIAEQTNLLALNAAIEAARAGEQGRGFSVVADEVRKLAEKTRQSTEQIGITIQGMLTRTTRAVERMQRSVDMVREGQQLAQEVGGVVAQIEQGSDQVAGSVESINAALREQRSASQEVAANVERIAQMTEQTNASAEATRRLAADLRTLSTNINQQVGRFRLLDNAQASA